MFKWMSAFALAMLVCAPALAEEEEQEQEYSRPGYYQYYYLYRYSLPPEQHVIEVVQPPYSGNFIINGTRFTARTPSCFSWAAGERIRLIARAFITSIVATPATCGAAAAVGGGEEDVFCGRETAVLYGELSRGAGG